MFFLSTLVKESILPRNLVYL